MNGIFKDGLDALLYVSLGFWINASCCRFEESPGKA